MPYTLTDLVLDCATGIGLIVILLCAVIGAIVVLDQIHAYGWRRGWWRLFWLLLIVLVPSSAFAQEPRIVYPALITARALDLHSTHVAIAAGATEINPLMKLPAVRYTLHPLMTAGFIASAEKARKAGKKKSAFWLLVAGTVGQVAVDVHNYRTANRLKER